MSVGTEYILERQFDAPREHVWQAWTDAAMVSEWYGPNAETIIHQFDVTPGGQWHNEWKMGDNSMYQRLDYVEVEAPERLVYRMNSSNESWEVVAMPMMPNWPKTVLTTVTLADRDGGTHMTIVQTPVDCTDEEDAMFQQSIDHMNGGWNQGFDIIDSLLIKLK